MHRLLACTVALAVSAFGSLVAHTAAYALTGTSAGDVHGYLEHAPQLLGVIATLALGAAAIAGRTQRLAAWPFPLVALAAFAAQEHVERLAHTGEVPWLLTEPAFLAGLLLQLPFALAAWWLARLLLTAARHGFRRVPPRLPRLVLAVVPAATGPLHAPATATSRGRAPPRALV
jgi:hypothetical protein